MHMYKICSVTFYLLPTCFNHICHHHQGNFTGVLRMQETAKLCVTTQSYRCYNVDWFHLLSLAIYCVLSALVMLP